MTRSLHRCRTENHHPTIMCERPHTYMFVLPCVTCFRKQAPPVWTLQPILGHRRQALDKKGQSVPAFPRVPEVSLTEQDLPRQVKGQA